jgi:hypothetical protein
MTSQNKGQTTAKTAEEPKKSYDKLVAKLQSRGISLVEFAHVTESRRKKMLKDDYQDIKNETGWLYDEPIEYPAEVIQKEKDLEKTKIEALSKTK